MEENEIPTTLPSEDIEVAALPDLPDESPASPFDKVDVSSLFAPEDQASPFETMPQVSERPPV